MKTAPFIAIEGPIGAGKTTLATMLSEELGFPMINEIVEDNPYLDKFYDNIEEWSFQLEMFFLCHRYKQLEDTSDHFLEKGQPVIADYHIYKNVIFAERTLSQHQLEKYKKIYHLLTDDLPKPNVIIYIKASLSTLLHRIEKRGRPFEKKIETTYLEQLIADYEVAIRQLQEADPELTVLTIDGDSKDFVLNKSDFERIAAHVKELII
ncbi:MULTISPECIES: deoxyguanosine kinase [unclassified Bacillus (in: firmicutes)]|uniref:deoxyguanosine kinase n=1 Tax=unclassified Bacillus (in: firmicutes) TaxID=185979 RepID=UPI002280BC6D|nr:deoxyguanosine kinase [Bacillus sp. S20C3]MCY8205819.1 deoxyguanosine kinase [Bacillus sp. N12A5]MCY8290344.1 deoxyguanosine kinase [Bacillus sp. N13C7]MCY8640285.1 deoxyguanosine kinase [Bacillus sp. S17B2]MCY8718177.1 deoxyguanosine kinase [Bacillus sp. S10C12M]MCY9145970.1 deoxyguanosine kinase [Bacillus sp. T9C1]